VDRVRGRRDLACAVVSIAVSGGSEVTVNARSSADPPLHRLVDQILTSSPRAQPLELELRSESAWPAFAGAVLELEQRGAEVEIERSPVTALLFQPDSLTEARRPSRLVFVEATGAGRASQAGRVVARYRRWLVERAGDDDQAG